MRLASGLMLASVLVSCGSPAASPPVDTTPGATARTTATSASASGAPASAPRPAFLTYAFTDVRDGSQFRLADFSGKTVLVIGMAVW